jgi:hypothetical protein
MNARLQVVLPSVFGVVSVPLIIWDVHNLRVIDSMGMAWDMGAPVWPYQTPDILLRFLNGPAYFVAVPLSNFLGLYASGSYALIFPAILIWWWFLGRRFDRGLGKNTACRRWPLFAILIGFAGVLLSAATVSAIHVLRWWLRYGEGLGTVQSLLSLRFLSPAIWCTALTFILVAAARRVALR